MAPEAVPAKIPTAPLASEVIDPLLLMVMELPKGAGPTPGSPVAAMPSDTPLMESEFVIEMVLWARSVALMPAYPAEIDPPEATTETPPAPP